jgi:hypothetical protein
MPRETVDLKIADRETYEAGAEFFAYLAYPDDQRLRQQFWIVLCRAYLSDRASQPNWAWQVQPIKPVFFSAHNREEAQKIFIKGYWKLCERLSSAACIALPHVLGMKKIKGFPPTVENLILNWGLPSRRSEQTEPPNASTKKSRVWMPSRPVIHAATALLICLGPDGIMPQMFRFMESSISLSLLVYLTRQIGYRLVEYKHPNSRKIYREEQLIEFFIDSVRGEFVPLSQDDVVKFFIVMGKKFIEPSDVKDACTSKRKKIAA